MNATLMAQSIVANLVAAGVGHVVVCPGSRSGPLALAVAHAAETGMVRAHVRLDERGAAFFALGLAKSLLISAPDELAAAASGAPGGERAGRSPGPLVAVVVTSGTAVANLHPAVLEARHGRVPLVVVTADRPHEMRGVGASQTTNQARIFGEAVRFFADVPAEGPVGSVVQRAVASSIGYWRLPDGAVGRIDELRRQEAAWGYRDVDLSMLDWSERSGWGPVHLNVAFRDPLLRPHEGADSLYEAHGITPPPGGHLPTSAQPVAATIAVGPGTVVLAGDGGIEAGRFAGQAFLPLLAEPSSGLRTHPTAVGPYRDLLDSPLGEAITQVVVFGHPTLSRPVSALLARPNVRVIVVDDGAEWTDVAANAAAVFPAVEPELELRAGDLLGADWADQAGRGRQEQPSDFHAAWTSTWVAAGRLAQESLSALLVQEEGMTAWGACARIWEQHLADWRKGKEPVLTIGASAAIRHFDLLAGCALGSPDEPGRTTSAQMQGQFRAGVNVLSNRGLAGIDGTIATAAGVAARTGRPVRCVVGDLTFLHDAGSLLRGVLEEEVDLDVIVLNDAGGAIFATLEAGDGRTGEHFDRFWGTPQDVEIKALAAAYKCRYTRVESAADLARALGRQPKGRRVIEVRCERGEPRAAGQRMAGAVREALAGLA